MTELEEKRLQLAREVLNLSRNTLLVHLRFLDMALSRLRPVATDLAELATDGQYLAYDPGFVLRRYKQAKEIPVRDYLHVVLHCVFRHMYIHSLPDQSCWDLACDIAVEHTISGLHLRAAAAPREASQQAELQKLEKEVKPLTAEKLYRYFLDKQLPPGEMERLRALFAADQHDIWYLPPEQKLQITAQFRQSAIGAVVGRPQTGSSSVGAELFRVTKYDHIGPDSGQLTLTAADAEADWADVSQRMQQDLETFSKRQGTEAGNLMQNLAAVNREKYDYTAFLRKFAVLGEVMKINDDDLTTSTTPTA